MIIYTNKEKTNEGKYWHSQQAKIKFNQLIYCGEINQRVSEKKGKKKRGRDEKKVNLLREKKLGCVIEKSKSSRSGRRGPSRSRGTTGRRIRYRWSMVETATSFVSLLSSTSSLPSPSPSSPRQLLYVPIAFSQQSSCHYEAVLYAGSFPQNVVFFWRSSIFFSLFFFFSLLTAVSFHLFRCLHKVLVSFYILIRNFSFFAIYLYHTLEPPSSAGLDSIETKAGTYGEF